MKKFLLLIVLSLGLLSCYEQGEIRQEPIDFIQIHGKTYKLMSIVPCENCHPIWVIYPKDSLDTMPTSLNYTVSSGKHSRNQAVIKIN